MGEKDRGNDMNESSRMEGLGMRGKQKDEREKENRRGWNREKKGIKVWEKSDDKN